MISKVYEFQKEVWEQYFFINSHLHFFSSTMQHFFKAPRCFHCFTGINKHNTTCITQCCRERIAIQQHRLTGEF